MLHERYLDLLQLKLRSTLHLSIALSESSSSLIAWSLTGHCPLAVIEVLGERTKSIATSPGNKGRSTAYERAEG